MQEGRPSFPTGLLQTEACHQLRPQVMPQEARQMALSPPPYDSWKPDRPTTIFGPTDTINYQTVMRPIRDAARLPSGMDAAYAEMGGQVISRGGGHTTRTDSCHQLRPRSRAGSFKIYFANITRWTKMRGYLEEESNPLSCCDAICINEHHLRGSALVSEIKMMHKLGWLTAAEAAVANPAAPDAGPGHGGVAVFVKKNLHVRPLRPQSKQEIQQEEHRGVPTQWTAATVRLLETALIICTVYLAPGLGFTGTNWAILSEVANYVRGMGLPYLILGDFNAEICDLLPLGLHSYLGGEWRQPRGEVPGGHRAIDLALISHTLSPCIAVQWDREGPWASPHSGFTVILDKAAASMNTRVMVAPIPYIPAMGPDHPWCWHLQRAQHHLQEGEGRLREQGSPNLMQHEEVDSTYFAFMGAVESVWASRQCTEYDNLKHRRGWPIEAREVPLVASTPTGWRLRQSPLTAWYCLRARLANFIGAVRRSRSSIICDMRVALMKQLTKVQAQGRVLPDPQPELDVISSIEAISSMAEDSPRHKGILKGLDTMLQRIERRLLQDGRRSYQDWIREQLKTGAGALHRLSTSWGEPLKALAPECDEAGEVMVEPLDIAAAKAQRWGKLWRTDVQPSWTSWWAKLRERADSQERTEIEVEAVRSALKVFKAHVGLGLDKVNPRWLLDLPDGAHDTLVALLECIERRLAWPTAMLENLVALLHKSEVADRPITLTQSLYRLWGRVRKCQVTSWTRAGAGHWDAAVSGSSPLRAALMRQVKLEIATAQQIPWAEILWDINKFYDSVNLGVVAEVGFKQDYPLINLFLGLQMAAAPRRIKTDVCVSEVLKPTVSLIAGCWQAVDFSRLALWDVLEHLHAQYRPLDLGSWVDDLGHTEIGPEALVISRTVAVSRQLVRGLRAQGFTMSPKSAILTSAGKITKAVVEQLKSSGIDLTAARQVRDLGIDGHSKRRSTRVMQDRIKKATHKA